MINSARLWNVASRTIAVLVLIFLLSPILAIIPLSFNSGSILAYPLDGVSLKWYGVFFMSARWWSAISNSLIVGCATILLATPIGTLAALGLTMIDFRGKAFLTAVLLSPMIIPTIITGIGIYFFFAQRGLANSLTGLVLAHTALALPFVLITVSASLKQFDRTLLKAGASLGAGPISAFHRIALPLIMPGIASGAIFAFTTSFDEVVVAIMLTGPAQRTLPRELLSGTRENLDPTILAVATVLIVVSAAMLLLLTYIQNRSRKLLVA
jgi:putative spermidine/putrescine transport system permease protein